MFRIPRVGRSAARLVALSALFGGLAAAGDNEESADVARAEAEYERKIAQLDELGCRRLTFNAFGLGGWDRLRSGVAIRLGTSRYGISGLAHADFAAVDLRWICHPATREELVAAGFGDWDIDWLLNARWLVFVSTGVEVGFGSGPLRLRPYASVRAGMNGWANPIRELRLSVGPFLSAKSTAWVVALTLRSAVIEVGARWEFAGSGFESAATLGLRL